MKTLIFAVIMLGVPLGTGWWWWWTDCRLREAFRGRREAVGGLAGGGDSRRGWVLRLAGWGVRVGVAAVAVMALFAFGATVLGQLLSWATERRIQWAMPQSVQTVAMVWGLLVLPWILVLGGLTLLGYGVLAGVTRWRERGALAEGEAEEEAGKETWAVEQEEATAGGDGVTRRQVMLASAGALPAVLTLGASGVSLYQLRHFRVRELEVPIAGLPEALNGVRIAHLSDTHVGRLTQGSVLDAIVGATNDLAADLVMFTGDLINHNIKDLPPAMRMLDRLDRRQGMFIVEGNHDLFHGRASFVDPMREAGLPLLDQEVGSVDLRGHRVEVLGMRMAYAEYEQAVGAMVDQARQAVSASADLRVLLTHHPHAFDAAAAMGVDLTLAGHTHGGQLNVGPFAFGPALYRYWSGIYAKQGRAAAVSNGVGNWFPLRIGAQLRFFA